MIAAVRDAVAGRCPVSAALGELSDFSGIAPVGVDFVKCGLANMSQQRDGLPRWTAFRDASLPAKAVYVAYADWQCARAPSVETVTALALRQPGSILLVDTCCKDKIIDGRRATLLDWVPLPWIAALVREVHAAHGRIALAGSLGFAEMSEIRPYAPDWIAVRGAACASSDRAAEIDRGRVCRIKTLLRGVCEN